MPKKVDSYESLGIERPSQQPAGAVGHLRTGRISIVLSPNTQAMVEFDKLAREKGKNPLSVYFAGGAEQHDLQFDSKSYIVALAEMLKRQFPGARLAETLAAADQQAPAAIVLVEVFNQMDTEGAFGPTALVTKWEGRFDFLAPGTPRRVYRTLESVVTAKCPPPNWGGGSEHTLCDHRARDQMLGGLRDKLNAAMGGS